MLALEKILGFFILLQGAGACTKSSIETVTETNPSKTNNSGGGEGGGSNTPLVALGSVLSNGFINASLSSSQDPLILVSDADNSTITFAIVSSTDTCSANSTFPLSTVPLISSLTVDGSYKVCAKVQDVMSTSPVILESAIINRDTLPPTISSITSQGPIADNVISGSEVASSADLIATAISGQSQVYYAVVSDGICSSATSATSTIIPTALSIPSNGSYQICVKAVDLAGNESYLLSTGFTRSGNQAPTDLSLSASSLAENAGADYVIGNLSSTDADGGDTHTYTFVSGTGADDNASFNLNGSQLRATASFNFETKATYSIRLKTADSGAGNLSFEKVFTISVTNANEAPTSLALSSTSIAENLASGASVGNFSSVDPDSGDSFTYSLVAGAGSTDNASFTISGASLLSAASFNYEVKSSYAIRVRSTDSGGLTFEQTFTISVSNVNEAPTDLSLSVSSILEGQATGTTIGAFSSTDPDASDTFTYTLVSGGGSTDNGSFSISGSNLLSGAVFVYTTKSSYSIRVRTADAGGLNFEKVLTITITQASGGSGMAALADACKGTPNATKTASSADGFGGGTPGNPYRICTKAQLLNINACNCPDKFFIQMADIPMTGETTFAPFRLVNGEYDGNNYKITGLNVTNPAGSVPASFIREFGDSTLKNLTFEDLTLSSNVSSAGVVGVGTISSAKILNVHVTGNSTITGKTYVGGLIAWHELNLLIKDSSIDADLSVSGGYGWVGGLIGANEYSPVVIETSSAKGGITNSVATGSSGGLVGAHNYSDLTIRDSFADMDLTQVPSNASHNVGGIVGLLDDNAGTDRFYRVVSTSFLPQNAALKGALVAKVGNNAYISFEDENYFDADRAFTTAHVGSGNHSAGGWTVASSSELKTKSFLTNLTWGTDWYIQNGSGYPQLIRLPGGCSAASSAGESFTSFSQSGDGTTDKPHLICSAAQLTNFATSVSGCGASGTAGCGKHFVLGANLSMGAGPHTMIATAVTPFSGTFDGRRHTIADFQVSNTGNPYTGLFRRMQASGNGYMVRGLGLTGLLSISGRNYVGGIAGEFNPNGYSIYLAEVFTEGSVSGIGHSSGSGAVGGLIGSLHAQTLYVFNVYSKANISFNANSVTSSLGIAGLIGDHALLSSTNLYLQDSFYEGDIDITGSSGTISYLAGLRAGHAYGVIAERVYAKSIFTGSSGVTVTAGGLFGSQEQSTFVSNFYSRVTDSLSASSSFGGFGITAIADIDIENGLILGYIPNQANSGIFFAGLSDVLYTSLFFDETVISNSSAFYFESPSHNRSTSTLKTASTYTNAGWVGFSTNWKVDTANDGYPSFKWQ